MTRYFRPCHSSSC